MIAYFIGSSSAFSQTVINELREYSFTVYEFGRSNLDYASYNQMETEFNKYPSPDVVIFNQHIEGAFPDDPAEFDAKIHEFHINENAKIFNKTFYGKLYIYNILKEKATTFVFITSSITTLEDEYGLNCISYRQLRASEQQIMKCISFIEGKLSYGLCPGGLDENPELYAKTTARIISLNDNNLNGKITLVKGYINE